MSRQSKVFGIEIFCHRKLFFYLAVFWLKAKLIESIKKPRFQALKSSKFANSVDLRMIYKQTFCAAFWRSFLTSTISSILCTFHMYGFIGNILTRREGLCSQLVRSGENATSIPEFEINQIPHHISYP